MSNKLFNRIVNLDMAEDTSPTHIYVDLSFQNSSNKAQNLIFEETRSKAFIQDSGQYYLSVVRFHIDTTSLPVMICRVLTGQTNINKSVYSITMKYKDIVNQEYLIFNPQDLTASQPKSPQDFQDLSTGYYFLYNYSYFVNLVNETFKNCFNNLKTAVEDAEDTLPTNIPPFIVYDPSSGEMLINMDKLGYDNALTDYIQIYFNEPMHNLFSSFEFIINSKTDINGMNYLLNVVNNGVNLLDLDTYTAIQLYQEYPCISNWSCLQSVIICSSNLPINPSIRSAPTQFGNNASATTQQSMSLNVLTDFEIGLTTGKEMKPSINYAPSIYRIIDMFGHNEIDKVYIEVYWSDIYNNIYPLQCKYNENSNIKLMFRKKYLGI
jgi:hypothetical protein